MTRNTVDILVTLAAIPILAFSQLWGWGFEFTRYNIMAALCISGVVLSIAHAIHEGRRSRNV